MKIKAEGGELYRQLAALMAALQGQHRQVAAGLAGYCRDAFAANAARW